MLKVKMFMVFILVFASYLVAYEEEEQRSLTPIKLMVHAKNFSLQLTYQIPSNNEYDKKTLVHIKLGTIALVKKKSKEVLKSVDGKKELKKELVDMINSNLENSNVTTIYYSKFLLKSKEISNMTSNVTSKKSDLSRIKIDKKSLALKKYRASYKFLLKEKKIDTTSEKYQNALFEAEDATRLDPSKSKYWINYAMLLLPLENVQEAQVSAEVAAKIAYSLNKKNDEKVNMILLQSYINQFDFIKASEVIKELLEKEPVLINNLYISDTFVSIYAFSGELEDGIDYLASLISKHPSYYGAIIAEIKLHKINKTTDNVDDLKDNLKFIYKKYRKRLTSDVSSTIKTILEDS